MNNYDQNYLINYINEYNQYSLPLNDDNNIQYNNNQKNIILNEENEESTGILGTIYKKVVSIFSKIFGIGLENTNTIEISDFASKANEAYTKFKNMLDDKFNVNLMTFKSTNKKQAYTYYTGVGSAEKIEWLMNIKKENNRSLLKMIFYHPMCLSLLTTWNSITRLGSLQSFKVNYNEETKKIESNFSSQINVYISEDIIDVLNEDQLVALLIHCIGANIKSFAYCISNIAAKITVITAFLGYISNDSRITTIITCIAASFFIFRVYNLFFKLIFKNTSGDKLVIECGYKDHLKEAIDIIERNSDNAYEEMSASSSGIMKWIGIGISKIIKKFKLGAHSYMLDKNKEFIDKQKAADEKERERRAKNADKVDSLVQQEIFNTLDYYYKLETLNEKILKYNNININNKWGIL